MTGEHNSLTVGQSGATAEVVSAEPCHIVLDTSPPDYVEKISRYLETSAVHAHGKVSDVSAEADSSDSGDSLFFTQKAVPEAVRSRRRHVRSSRSKPISPRALEESEYDSEEDGSSSASHEESKNKGKRKTYTLPKYHFPFLPHQKSKPGRPQSSDQNPSLHNSVMGGFFKCVAELWQGYQREDLRPSLPTVDTDEKNISPLSEEDEGGSEDEDIKVVDRKCFLMTSRAKRQPTWCNQVTQKRTKKAVEEELRNGNDATVCEPSKLTLTETQTDAFHMDDLLQTGQAGDVPGSQDLPHSLPHLLDDSSDDSVYNATMERNKKDRGHHEGVEEENCQKSQKEPESAPPVIVEETPTFSDVNRAMEKLESEADTGLCPPDGLVVLKKKKKRSKHESRHQTQDGPLAATEDVQTTAPICSEVVTHKDLPHILPHLLDNAYDDRGDHEGVEEENCQSQKEPECAPPVIVEVEKTPCLSEVNKAMEKLESEADTGLSPPDGPVVSKKKKKKKRNKHEACHETQDGPSTATEDVQSTMTVCSEVVTHKNLSHSLLNILDDGYDDRGNLEGVEENCQSQKEPESATSVNVEVEEIPTLSEVNRAEPPAVQATDELGFSDKNGMENSSLDDNKVRQEEENTPSSKQKKNKRKRKKSAAEDVGEEVNGKVESNVTAENVELSESFNMEECGKDKKKKKKRRRSAGDVEHLKSNDAETHKNKKRKEEGGKGIAFGDCEDEATNRTSYLTPEQFEDSRKCLENSAFSHETLESCHSHVKSKKHKKKHQLPSVDKAQEGENYADMNFGMDDSVTVANGSGASQKKKKKKKTAFEGIDVSYTHEENEKVEYRDNTQTTPEVFEDRNPEPVTKKKKKKKKKMSEIFMTNSDIETQNDDSVSVWEKETTWTSSFLVADAEEKDAETHEEQISPMKPYFWGAEKHGVSAGDLKKPKKKKKRKMSVSQDNMENNCERDVEELNKTCQSASSETTDTGLKRKKKRTGNESVSVTPMEKLESEADTGLSPPDGPLVLRKKKKGSKHELCHETQDVPSTATEDVKSTTTVSFEAISHTSQDSSTSDRATVDNIVEHASASSNTPENQELNDNRKKKRRRKKSAD